MFPTVLPFFQRTPTTIGVLGFQAGRTVGVAHAVLHFYFGDLNKRKRMQISFYIPGARSEIGGCDISRSVRRRFQAAAVKRLASMVQWTRTLPCGRTNQAGCPQMLKGYNKKTHIDGTFRCCCNPKEWVSVLYTVLRSVEARTEM